MITLTSLICPNCGAKLNVQEGKKQFYCNYCGVKIMMSDENEHTSRFIDEAAIVKANAEKEVRLKEMQNEEKEKRRDSIQMVLILLFVVIVFLLYKLEYYGFFQR